MSKNKNGFLVLSCTTNKDSMSGIVIDNEIFVLVSKVDRNQVKLAIKAPKDIKIDRIKLKKDKN